MRGDAGDGVRASEPCDSKGQVRWVGAFAKFASTVVSLTTLRVKNGLPLVCNVTVICVDFGVGCLAHGFEERLHPRHTRQRGKCRRDAIQTRNELVK